MKLVRDTGIEPVTHGYSLSCLLVQNISGPYRGSVRTATRTATRSNSGVFGKVRPCTDLAIYLRKPIIGEHPRTSLSNLGVKWSQVQILSARPVQMRLFRTSSVALKLASYP